MSFVNRLDF